MYRLLIVDDEEIEREGMVQFIPWEKYGVQLVGAAWNGIEALTIIKEEKPDIVLTDIKMPVMDGITLIREAKKIYCDMEFIVLSGYGEYEFTSQAMEEGIRHYILKPFDERKILEVLEKVKEEIQRKRMSFAEKQNYRAAVRSLLPRAKEQIFRNLLLGREQMKEDYKMFVKEMGDEKRPVMVLAVRSQMEMDDLAQFVIGNILNELLGEAQILMSAFVQNEVLFLLDEGCRERVEEAVVRTQTELTKLKPMPLSVALSETGQLDSVNELYQQTQELFRMGTADLEGDSQGQVLHYGMFRELKKEAEMLVNYQRLAETKDFGVVLFECYLAYLKMALKGFSLRQMEEVFSWTIKILCTDGKMGTGKDEPDKHPEETDKKEFSQDFIEWKLVETAVLSIAGGKGLPSGKEDLRARKILLAVYQNLNNPEISIHYLAQNVLFVNEDHFGRIFLKYQKKKFSTFLLEQRIELAKGLIRFGPKEKLSDIAQLVGYPPDGQYFSKMFKKVTGSSPSEYKEQSLQKERERRREEGWQ